MGNENLSEVLDGLVEAAKYAEDIGEPELAEEISECYQELGRAAPDEHWEGVENAQSPHNDDVRFEENSGGKGSNGGE